MKKENSCGQSCISWLNIIKQSHTYDKNNILPQNSQKMTV
jgi:hypothetical protein